MKTLLKDMPEHAERIENNFILIGEVKDILDDQSDWSDTRGTNVIDEDDFVKISELIIAKITAFVNQNYTWKGIAK